MLHEMRYLGADIMDNNKILSHEDINWLDPEDAKRISIDLRYELGEEGILTLFKDVLTDSDRRWKEFNKEPIKEQGVQSCQIDLIVSGLTVKELLPSQEDGDKNGALFNLEDDRRAGLAIFPEHYLARGTTKGVCGMENFGMFGEPTYVTGDIAADIPDYLPFKRDPDYPVCGAGEMRLQSDGTPIHVGAIHQYRPTENGFFLKSTFFCPKNAPKSVADGHKLHFAIELTNLIRATYNRLNKK